MERFLSPSTLTPSLLGLPPPPQLPPSPRPTYEADLRFLRAASSQMPQLLAHQARHSGHVHLTQQLLRQVSQ